MSSSAAINHSDSSSSSQSSSNKKHFWEQSSDDLIVNPTKEQQQSTWRCNICFDFALDIVLLSCNCNYKQCMNCTENHSKCGVCKKEIVRPFEANKLYRNLLEDQMKLRCITPNCNEIFTNLNNTTQQHYDSCLSNQLTSLFEKNTCKNSRISKEKFSGLCDIVTNMVQYCRKENDNPKMYTSDMINVSNKFNINKNVAIDNISLNGGDGGNISLNIESSNYSLELMFSKPVFLYATNVYYAKHDYVAFYSSDGIIARDWSVSTNTYHVNDIDVIQFIYGFQHEAYFKQQAAAFLKRSRIHQRSSDNRNIDNRQILRQRLLLFRSPPASPPTSPPTSPLLL